MQLKKCVALQIKMDEKNAFSMLSVFERDTSTRKTFFIAVFTQFHCCRFFSFYRFLRCSHIFDGRFHSHHSLDILTKRVFFFRPYFRIADENRSNHVKISPIFLYLVCSAGAYMRWRWFITILRHIQCLFGIIVSCVQYKMNIVQGLPYSTRIIQLKYTVLITWILLVLFSESMRGLWHFVWNISVRVWIFKYDF